MCTEVLYALLHGTEMILPFFLAYLLFNQACANILCCGVMKDNWMEFMQMPQLLGF